MRGVLIRAVIALFLVVLITAGLFWWSSLSNEKVEIYIPQGSSAGEITSMFREKGLISSKKLFSIALKIMRKEKKLKCGLYEISPRDSIFSIINTVSQGKAVYITV